MYKNVLRQFNKKMNKRIPRLKIGDKAPDFSANDQSGNKINLTDFRGKKVVLYFYPEYDTPGCTVQSCNLRDHYQTLLDKGYEVLGVSNDDEESHRKFIKKFSLPFTLIADTDKKIVHDYDVYGEKQFMGNKYEGIHRITYVIDERGYIENIITHVDTEHHTDQILAEPKSV